MERIWNFKNIRRWGISSYSSSNKWTKENITKNIKRWSKKR